MIAAAVIAIASCSWTHPGADRYTGTDAAVEDFQAIPAPVRAVLRERVRKHEYDDVATITRDKIKGAADYDDLRDMHFGKNKMCMSVERDWAPAHTEVGLVYCEGEHCLIVPTVCGNIALVTRRRPGGVAGRPQEGLVATPVDGPAIAVAADESATSIDSLGSLDDLPPTGAGLQGGASSFASGSASTVSTGVTGPISASSSIPVMASASGIGYGGGGLLLPQTTIAPVPEPATWALMFAGVAAIGVAARQRKHESSAVASDSGR